MAALIAFYSRAGENYFGGAYRRISVGNTEVVLSRAGVKCDQCCHCFAPFLSLCAKSGAWFC